MLLFAGLLSAFFSVLLRRERRERIKFGLLMWSGLVGGALFLAFLMAP
jgi:drug/metabolite transporter (DMT)-like permease